MRCWIRSSPVSLAPHPPAPTNFIAPILIVCIGSPSSRNANRESWGNTGLSPRRHPNNPREQVSCRLSPASEPAEHIPGLWVVRPITPPVSDSDPLESNRVNEISSVGPTVGSCDDGRVSVGHSGTPCLRHPAYGKEKWLGLRASKTIRFDSPRRGDCSPVSSSHASKPELFPILVETGVHRQRALEESLDGWAVVPPSEGVAGALEAVDDVIAHGWLLTDDSNGN